MAKYTVIIAEDTRQRIHALPGRVHFSAFMRKAVTVFVEELEKNPDLRPEDFSEAAVMGDRPENAEYIYGKKQLRQLDSRMRFFTKGLNELVAVDRTPDDMTRVFFGRSNEEIIRKMPCSVLLVKKEPEPLKEGQ
jgi:hypothetical protein